MATLTIQSGKRQGQKIEITQNKTTIGRTDDNAVPLDDVSTSSKHCVILRDGEHYTIRDTGSTNGTQVNGALVTESALKPGDQLTVGSVEILFEGEDVAVDATPAPKPGATPFTARQQSRNFWLVVIIIVGALTLVAAAWFLFTLFRSGA